MNKFKDIAIVIPVKKQSRRVPNKNFRDFVVVNKKKMSLLEWKLSQLTSIFNPSQIFISSDKKDIIPILDKYNVNFLFRDSKFCDEEKISFSEVIKYICQSIPFPIIAWSHVVVPYMFPSSYLKAFEIFIQECGEGKNYDSLATFLEEKAYFWDEKKALNYEANKLHSISQKLPPLYRISNGLFICKKKIILENEYFIGENPYKFLVSKLEAIDIDDLEDFQLSQHLLTLYLERIKKK